MAVRQLGLGDYLDHYCSPKELRNLTIKIIEDSTIPRKLYDFSKIIEKQDPKIAVKDIID